MTTYKLKNIGALALGYLSSAALGAVSFSIGTPFTLAASAAVMGLLVKQLWKIRNFHKDILKEHKKSYEYSPRLQEIIDELTFKIGKKPGEVPVYDFETDDMKVESLKDEKRYLETGEALRLIGKTPNAAALSIDKSGVMISHSLLRLLNDDEEKAVLAHEFAHIKAKHTLASLPRQFIDVLASLSNSFMFIWQGVCVGVTGLAGAIGVAYITKKICNTQINEMILAYDSSPDKTERQGFEIKKAAQLSRIATGGMGIAALTLQSPTVATIFTASQLIGAGMKITQGLLSRSNEYQADRVAVELGGNPLALITSLQKLEAIRERSLSNMFNGDVPQRSKIGKLWKQLTATHPSTEKRISRLASIALARGFDAAVVEKVVNSRPDISKAPDIPYFVIKQALEA